MNNNIFTLAAKNIEAVPSAGPIPDIRGTMEDQTFKELQFSNEPTAY